LLGFTQKEWLEDPVLWYRQLHPDDRERWNTRFAPTCAMGTPFREVYRFIAKDGRVVWVQGAANVVRDEHGRALFLQGLAFDITSIKEAEETLREQARLLALEAAVGVILTRTSALRSMLQECTEALVEHLGVAFARIWALNPGDNVLELQASAGMYTHLDGPHGRIPLGQHKIGLIAQEKRSHFTNDVANDPRISDRKWASREGMSAFAGCPLVVDENAIGVMALFSRTSLTGKVHEALELIAAHVSLGIKRKQTEAELEQRVQQRTRELAESMEALREKKEELEQFAHVAAHDFNEPLRSIVNYPQKLWDTYQDQLDEQAKGWLERTLAGVRRMRRLIEDVQQYSRVLRRELAVAPVDCNAAFANACANLDAVIQANEARVTADSLPTVQGYETDLILLFQNLINNAIKFRSADRPPVVHAWAERQENGWRISVRDNGIGMESKYLVKVFGLGDRLHSASRYPGTGFGLAICEKIVRTHRGRIWAESELGVGSTFHFVIPEE
jgi:PAS domain S-box-containing protein